MKTFKRPFNVVVELRPVGQRVVAVRVSSMLQFHRHDLAKFARRILRELFPACDLYELYDGTFIVPEATPLVVELCDSDCDFCMDVMLGSSVSSLTFHVVKSDDPYKDYMVGDSRTLALDCDVELPVGDDNGEAFEE